jgi:ABC-type polysaccharide/polyol phosphate export permease
VNAQVEATLVGPADPLDVPAPAEPPYGVPGGRAPTPPRSSVMDDYREIVSDLWHGRDLLHQLTLRDIRIRYKQAVMGFGWSVFMPIMVILSGALVRYSMAHVSGGAFDTADIAGLAVKALPWAFFVGTIGFATASLTSNMHLVSKVYFPREVLPLSATLAQCFDTLIGLAALTVLLPFLGVRPSWAMLWVPVLLLLLVLFTAAASLFLSCANLFFRDVKYIVQVMLTFGIFFTPVFFEPAMLGTKGSRIVMLNPLSPILEGMRLAVVKGHNLLVPITETAKGAVVWDPWYLAYAALWAVGGLLAAALLFHRSEFVFAEYV